MKEHHYAYKIIGGSTDLVCTKSEFTEDRMLDLLQEIKDSRPDGLFWIFKQLDNQEREPLCLIDCAQQRIYYHYSGDVEDLSETIEKLSK